MNITFTPLTELHFPLLLQWLESEHVKIWWDKDVKWTQEAIYEKYNHYVKGYKLLKLKDSTIMKPIQAFIILCDDVSVGYAQYYNKHDFQSNHGYELSDLPRSCAGCDIYIGNPEFIGKGIGSKAIEHLIATHIFPKYDYVFVDPEKNNLPAIRSYEKAGFAKVTEVSSVIWMIKCRQVMRISVQDRLSIESLFHKHFLLDDSLWIFGSRVDMTRKGGDIDLYIETSKDHVQAFDSKINFLCDLKRKIGDQKIDVVLNIKSLNQDLPIHHIAKTEGIKII